MCVFSGGFYEPLLSFLDHTVTERFVSAEHRAIVQAATTPSDLLDRLVVWHPPEGATEKWWDR